MQISPNSAKMKAIMRCLNGCKELLYRDQLLNHEDLNDSWFNDAFDHTDIEYFENNIEKLQLLKDIIALADVARSKTFTTDTSDRELLSDIFTEIFVKAHEIRTILDYGSKK